MKTIKFSLVLCTRENTDVFITLDENIYGIHYKRVNILYIFWPTLQQPPVCSCQFYVFLTHCRLSELSQLYIGRLYCQF